MIKSIHRPIHVAPDFASWPVYRLEDVCDIASGVTLGRATSSKKVRSVPYLRVANVKDGRLDLTEIKIVEATEIEIEKLALRSGDVLLTEGGDPDKLGRGTFWEDQLPECIHQNYIFRARFPKERVCHEFAAYQFGSAYGKAYFAKYAKQTTGIACINRTILGGFPLRIPPIEEQRRLAAQLRQQLSTVAEARAALQAQLKAAAALPGAYLREVFASKASEAWPSISIDQIAGVCGGIQKTPDRTPRNFHRPFLTVRNVQHGYLNLDNVEQFEITPKELERSRLEKGDLLIVEGNGSLDHIGRSAVFDQEGEWVHQNHIIRVRFIPHLAFPKYVARFLASSAGREQLIEKAMTTTGLHTLSTSKVAKLSIPLPPLREQRAIAARLDETFARVATLRASLEARLAAVERLPAALLREVFGG